MTSIRVQRHASLAKPATLKPFHLRGTRNTLAHMRALCDSASVMQYVQQRQLLPGPELEVFEYEEGKLNHVFRVSSPGTSAQPIIVKHAPPYAKSLGKEYHLSPERLRIEASAMELVHSHAPEHVPAIYLYDEENSVMVMQFLPAPHMKVMLGLHVHGFVFPHLPSHLSSILAASLFHTSVNTLSKASLASYTERFANTVIVEANERVVLTEPLDANCKANRPLSPIVHQQATALRSDAMVLQAMHECVHAYRTKKEALLHNDLHTGNLLATRTSTYCIDWEFATMGPLGFDLGCLLGVLLLAYIVLRRQPEVSQEEQALEQGQVAHSREQQCCWLLGAICELWRTLDQRFKDLSVAEAAAKRTSDGGGPAEARSAMCLGPHSDSVWRETRQFAAFALIRLTIGMHSYPGYEFLRDATSRTHAELDALRVARGLLDMRADVIDGGAEQNRMEGLTQVVQSIGTS